MSGLSDMASSFRRVVMRMLGPLAFLFEAIERIIRGVAKILRRIFRGIGNAGEIADGPDTLREPGGELGVPLAVAIFYTPLLFSVMYWRSGFGIRWFLAGTSFFIVACVLVGRTVSDPKALDGTPAGMIRKYVRTISKNFGVRTLDRIGVSASAFLLYECLPYFDLPFPLFGVARIFGGHTEFVMAAAFHFVGFTYLMSEEQQQRDVPIGPDLPYEIVGPTGEAALVRPRLEGKQPVLDIVSAESPDLVEREFTWTLAARGLVKAHVLTVPVSEKRYDEARAQDRDGTDPWTMVLHGRRTVDVARLARQLARLSARCAYENIDEIRNVMAFVDGAISRDSDEASSGRYPIETLHDGTGDYEDSMLLASALLLLLGHDVVLLRVPERLAIGVATDESGLDRLVVIGNRRYLYCETNAEGRHVGGMPEGMTRGDVTVIPRPGG